MRGSGLSWALLIDSPRPGWQNMALDSALLDLADREGAAFLRLYRWEPFCLSFGRHEPAARRYDRAKIAELGLDCVRRPTGGRAVWHARELTYSVAAPLEQLGSMILAYHLIHEMLAEALRTLGAAPTLAGRADAPILGAGPCFNRPVGGEVLLDQRKVVGSAQLRQGNAFLQHGSLLLEDDQSLPRRLAGLPDSDSDEIPLARKLGYEVPFEQAASHIISAASKRLGPLNAITELPGEAEDAAARHAERFRDPAWTWQR